MIIKYDVNCFERTLTIQCPDSYVGHEKKIFELLDKYYDQWHNPNEIEDDEDREWVETDACCEEYMMSKLTETYPECGDWNSVDYGENDLDEYDEKDISCRDWNMYCVTKIIEYLEGKNARLELYDAVGKEVSEILNDCIAKLTNIEEEE